MRMRVKDGWKKENPHGTGTVHASGHAALLMAAFWHKNGAALSATPTVFLKRLTPFSAPSFDSITIHLSYMAFPCHFPKFSGRIPEGPRRAAG